MTDGSQLMNGVDKINQGDVANGGIVSGNGHANGTTNGHVNGGIVNGHANGTINGHVNGAINGHHTNGDCPQLNGKFASCNGDHPGNCFQIWFSESL